MTDAIGGVFSLNTRAVAQPKRDSAESQDSRKVAEDFTTLFTTLIVKEMFATIKEDGESPFGSGPGADIYRGLAENSLAGSLSKSGMSSLTDRIQELIEGHASPAKVES